jgi:hypothetical protein
MPNDFEAALKSVAASVAKYVQDAATLQVETRYVEIGAGEPAFEKAPAAARTVIRLDGDSETVIPMRKGAGAALEVDSGLFELHQQNVAIAIDYRARILSSLLNTLPTRARTG